MRTPAYRVQLSPEERQELETVLNDTSQSVRKLRRAHVLLLADEGKRNQEIQQITGLSEPALIAIKKRFVEEGLSLKEKPRPGRRPKLNQDLESILIELTASEPPEGMPYWTMQLLADELIKRNVLESISDETVRRILKKRSLKLSKKRIVKVDDALD